MRIAAFAKGGTSIGRLTQSKSLWNSSLGYLFAFAIFQLTSVAATWYVDSAATGSGTGTSWVNAWRNTSAIVWTSVNPGDRIVLSGGSAGKSYAAFTTGKAGAAGSPITIERATEPGHDGKVTLATPIIIANQWIVLDGKDWLKTDVQCRSIDGTTEGSVSVRSGGNNFVLRNCKLTGTYSAGFGHSYATIAGDVTIERVWFDRSCYEDQIHYRGKGTINVRGCFFTQYNKPNDGSHRDLCNIWTTGGFNLNFDYNIVENDGNGDLWLMQNPSQIGTINMRYNVFANSSHALRFGSGNSGAQVVNLYNNVYHNTPDYDGPGAIATIRNCVFSGKDGYDRGAHIAPKGRTINSIWVGSTGSFETGAGNINNVATSVFRAYANVLGADRIPFTSDDGFNINAGSVPVNAGIGVGQSADILGNPLIGAPDIGAYEAVGGGSTTTPIVSVEPTTLNFGAVGLGGSKDLIVSVRNAGSGTLAGSVTTQAPFMVVGAQSYSLSAGQSATVTIRFTPTTVGVVNRSASFSGGNGGSVGLSGEGTSTGPAISLTPTSLQFGTVPGGSSKDLSVTVRNSGSGTLSGTASVGAPFQVVSGATYSLGAGQQQEVVIRYSPGSTGTHAQTVTFTGAAGGSIQVAGSSSPAGSELVLEAASGNITPPFVLSNGFVSQPSETDVQSGGRAVYDFVISQPGEYTISAILITPNEGANSFYVNIDASPDDPEMIWDAPVITAATKATVSWRGAGAYNNPEFPSKRFMLAAGSHQLVIVGREARAQFGRITLQLATVSQPPSAPQGLRIETQ